MALRSSRVATAVATIGIACLLALAHPISSEAAAAKAPAGSIYLMRGLANVFSLGFDTLNDELHARGVHSVVTGYGGWMGVAQEIEARYTRDKGALPVVLIGHSFGADATLYLAAELGKKNLPVALVVTFDVVTSISVPANVRHVVNFYTNGFGLRLKGAPGFRGRLENIDATKSDPEISHLTIEKSDRLHSRAIAEVLRLVGR